MTLTVVTTKEAVELCGIASNWIAAGYYDDHEAILFDNDGPHPSARGSPYAVYCAADCGPAWGIGGCLSTGKAVDWHGACSKTNMDSYPTWVGKGNELTILRVVVYHVTVGRPPPRLTSRSDVDAAMESMHAKMEKSFDALNAKVSAVAGAQSVALERIEMAMGNDRRIEDTERSLGQRLEGVRYAVMAVARDVVCLRDETAHMSGGPHEEMKSAIAKIAAEMAQLRGSILRGDHDSSAVFWVQLVSGDPTLPSTATAFKVRPLSADIDGLRDAVKLKVPEELVGVSVLRLQVWGHDAVSKQWVPVDEDAVLVANDKATAYHVVVLPKACF